MIKGKKLLQINVTANWGSTGRIAEHIGQIAITQGWNSYIAYGRQAGKSSSELIKIGSKRDYILHGLQTRLLDRHGLGSIQATEKLIERIELIDPQLIHLHNLHGYYLNVEILFRYLQKRNIPVVWTLHDCWAFTGHCSYFSFNCCDRWKNGCYQCPQRRDYPASFLLDMSNRNYKVKKAAFTSLQNLTVVPVSDWLADLVKKSFLNKYSIHRIYNGVNLNVFTPQLQNNYIKEKWGITEKKMLLGVGSIWSNRKGLHDYVALRQKLTDDYVIVLIGLSEKQLQSLPKGMVGIKRTDNEQELVAYYSAADMVLNLSYEETFGLTTVEGFACGTPCIGYDSTATPELISPDTGVVVKAGDIDMLLKAIAQVTEEKGNRFTAEQCRLRAEVYFDKNARYQEYFDLYKQILENK